MTQLAVLACCIQTERIQAQSSESQGLRGGIALGATQWRLDDRLYPTHFSGGLSAGYRIRLFNWGSAVFTATPQIGFTITEFRGIDLNSAQVGFSRLDVLGGQLAVRVRGIRPYIAAHQGKVTIERYVENELVNYYGSMPSYALGVELPRRNPCDAGFELAVRRTTGKLNNFETRGPTPRPGGSIGATIINIGWSGRFRGTQWLFKCR